MTRWVLRFALLLISVLGAGGLALGAASAETAAKELLATCLSCGEQWLYTPPTSLASGFLGLLKRRPVDKCPKCGSRAVSFAHRSHLPDQRTS